MEAFLLGLAGRIATEEFTITRAWTDEPYLTRWTLMGERFQPGRKVYLHRFHRGDYDEFHDHPWPFISIILAGGYWEKSDQGRRWFGPGDVLYRPAAWRHSVEIPEGKECWSLVFTGHKEREWGFWCSTGWKHWKEHFERMKATGDGCG